MRLIWDLETDGLLEDVTTIHSLLMFDIDAQQLYSCHDQEVYLAPPGVLQLSISDGLNLLAAADERIGHNVIKYDLRVLKKLYPNLVLNGIDRDTMILAKLIHSDIKEEDSRALASGRLNKETFKHKNRSCFGSHSLAAWGHRIGELKQEYSGGFDKWSPEMQSYGEQDIPVTYKLWLHLAPHTYSQDAIALEHRIADIVFQIEQDGIPFDLEKAIELQSKLVQERDDIKRSLMGLFPDWEVVTKTFIAKVNLPKRGIAKGDEVIVKKTVVFNPGSRDHIAKCLIDKYKWVPTEFTPTGKPTINDEVLSALDYPEAKRLNKYFVVCKTLAQLAEGDKNWMQYYSPATGTVHPKYDTMGTVTSRCSHFDFNVGQVPAIELEDIKDADGKKIGERILYGVEGGYGHECRELFGKPKDTEVLLGTDMSGLELRCLGGYMAHWDDGAYAKEVISGDVHSINQRAANIETRAKAKTFIYAFLYGSGPANLGSIVGAGYKRGKELIDKLLRGLPALKHLKAECEAAIGKGYLNALDGRKVPIRKKHAALNSLLQSAGAIFCKLWVVGIRDSLEAQGLTYGKDYRFVAFIHDELQIMVSKGFETIVGDTSKAVAVAVGERLKFKCPLAADYKIGNNWAETH